MDRKDGRLPDELRPVSYNLGFVDYPEGSVLISQGNTKVLCNVTIENSVPRWMADTGKLGGWITAEYALLPRSTHTRTSRETRGLRARNQEIRRMIGRSLRAAFDLSQLGEHTCIVDCDVIQADGGTRTAAITGAYVALKYALSQLVNKGIIPQTVFYPPIAAVSVGVVNGNCLLDLCYEEDSIADVDINVVMNAEGDFVEIQGTAEGDPFSTDVLNTMLHLARGGIKALIDSQKNILS